MRRLKRKTKRFLLNLFYRKLWVRIAIILLVIVTVPVVLLGILLIDTSQKAVRNSVLNNYQQLVSRTAEEIGLFIRRPQDILDTTAVMLGVVYPAPWKQETILVELVLNQPVFMRVVSVDLSGNVLASSEPSRGLRWDYPKEAWEEVIKSKTYTSRVKFLNNRTPFTTLAVPIKQMGKTTGALIAEVNLRDMWEIVDNIRIGQTGRAFLVSNDGTLIAHPDKKKVLRNENLRSQKEVQLVLAGRTGAIELGDKLEGKLISAYAPIRSLGWGVVLQQKQDEAYLFSKVMKIQSWIIIILSELAAIVVSVFMGKVLARPIKNLALRIKSVAAGDLEHKIKIRMRDDIGELIRSFNDMTKKLKRAKERERLSAIGEAVARITHELKNSFVSIKSFVQLIPLRHKDEKFVDKFTKLIPAEITRLEHMFKELSDFSANSELNIARVNPKEIMDNILEMIREELSGKKISIEYNPRSGNFHIEADPERLEQVFMNLIVNSINAMPDGGLLSVSIDSVTDGGRDSFTHIEISIKDTGQGISEEALGKIFEPFRTTKSGGMGLGLTISRKIIEQHGGNINVESAIGRGATFVVKLPVKYNSS